ncbi:30S ribosomal protein S9 [bacterium]|nr:30S ribosomal protein S9 [bacterium]
MKKESPKQKKEKQAKKSKTPAPKKQAKEKKQPLAKTKAQKEKEKAQKAESVKKKEDEKASQDRYFEAVGGRKTSTARVRLFTKGEHGIFINDKPLKEYFKNPFLEKIVTSPLEKINCEDKFRFTIKVKGGGFSGQAEACCHGISRALVLLNPYFKKRLKKAGFLTRDPRMRERKKFGKKRARRAPQWSKR